MTDKQNLLFIPGLLCDDMLWHHQVAYFKENYNIIVADVTRHESIDEMARSILNDAPEHFILCGLSMGGYVAQAIMAMAPTRVQKLILINTSSRPDSPETVRRRKGLISIATIGKFKGVTPKLLPLLIHETRLDDENITRLIMDMAERVGRDAFLRQQKAILGRPDFRLTLPDIGIPTLVIGGDADKITPADCARETASLIKEAELYIYETCGHLSPLEYPMDVNQRIERFINNG